MDLLSPAPAPRSCSSRPVALEGAGLACKRHQVFELNLMLTPSLGSVKRERRGPVAQKLKGCFVGWQIAEFQAVMGCLVVGIAFQCGSNLPVTSVP